MSEHSSSGDSAQSFSQILGSFPQQQQQTTFPSAAENKQQSAPSNCCLSLAAPQIVVSVTEAEEALTRVGIVPRKTVVELVEEFKPKRVLEVVAAAEKGHRTNAAGWVRWALKFKWKVQPVTLAMHEQAQQERKDAAEDNLDQQRDAEIRKRFKAAVQPADLHPRIAAALARAERKAI